MSDISGVEYEIDVQVEAPIIVVEGSGVGGGDIDGGAAASVYGAADVIDGGDASSVFDESETIDGGSA